MKLANLFLQKKFNFILQDDLFFWNIKIVFVLIVLQTTTLLFLWKNIPPQIPLLYTRPWGEDQLVAKKKLFLIPALLLILTPVNLCIGTAFFEREKLLSKIFVSVNFLIALLLSVAFFKILSLTTL